MPLGSARCWDRRLFLSWIRLESTWSCIYLGSKRLAITFGRLKQSGMQAYMEQTGLNIKGKRKVPQNDCEDYRKI